MSWQDTVDAVASGITAGGVVIGGVWAYRRFVREAPDFTRADAIVEAELYTSPLRPEIDALRVCATVCALGRARLVLDPKLVKHRYRENVRQSFGAPPNRTPVLGATVSVFAFVTTMLDELEE